MRIEFESGGESGRQFSKTYEGGQLDFDESELRLLEPIEVKGRIRHKSAEVELSGELRTRVAVPCDRCLREVETPIEVDFAERFITAVSWRNEELHELSKDDLNLGLVSDEAIELDDVVREEILLALPSQVLCDQSCKGICPSCGADRNAGDCSCESEQVDSRWEKLRNLQF
jgi:DUF177 domain-containing protein